MPPPGNRMGTRGRKAASSARRRLRRLPRGLDAVSAHHIRPENAGSRMDCSRRVARWRLAGRTRDAPNRRRTGWHTGCPKAMQVLGRLGRAGKRSGGTPAPHDHTQAQKGAGQRSRRRFGDHDPLPFQSVVRAAFKPCEREVPHRAGVEAGTCRRRGTVTCWAARAGATPRRPGRTVREPRSAPRRSLVHRGRGADRPSSSSRRACQRTAPGRSRCSRCSSQ